MEEGGRLRPETWVDEHGDYLLGYACKRIRDRSTAEDILQETFLAAIRSKSSFDGRCNIRYWLLGILKHKIVDHIRKASREVSMEDTDMLETESSVYFKTYGVPMRKPARWYLNPRLVFEQNEFWEVFSSCVSKLKGPVQQAYTLRELEGMSTTEACKVLDIEPNYLWVLLHRARDQLKVCLKKNWIDKNKGN